MFLKSLGSLGCIGILSTVVACGGGSGSGAQAGLGTEPETGVEPVVGEANIANTENTPLQQAGQTAAIAGLWDRSRPPLANYLHITEDGEWNEYVLRTNSTDTCYSKRSKQIIQSPNRVQDNMYLDAAAEVNEGGYDAYGYDLTLYMSVQNGTLEISQHNGHEYEVNYHPAVTHLTVADIPTCESQN